MSSLTVVILAAGQGSRMGTQTPKVCLPLGHQPMIAHVITTALTLQPDHLRVVVGEHQERIMKALPTELAQRVTWVQQPSPRGTGDAVKHGLTDIDGGGMTLVMFGDVPLVRSETCRQLLRDDQLTLLTAHYEHPTGLGRIVRDRSGNVACVIEDKHLTEDQQDLQECFTGILAAPTAFLAQSTSKLQPHQGSEEVYLPDVIPCWCASGQSPRAYVLQDTQEVQGANTLTQLADLEVIYQWRARHALLAQGVIMPSPASVTLRGHITAEPDCVIDQGVILEGDIHLEAGAYIGPYCVLNGVHVAKNARILSHSVLTNSHVDAQATIGPFAHLRAGTQAGPNSKIGSFVETKQTQLGRGSKIPHLSYIGDAVLGERVNIGAGTITCNYDGVHKHACHIGDDAFVGAHSVLVAPITVGEGATIGAASCLTRPAPAGILTLSRSPQRSIKDWRSPRQRLTEAAST